MTRAASIRAVLAASAAVALALLLPLGAEAAPAFAVNPTASGDQRAPDLAVDSVGNYLIVWQGPDGDGDGIFGRRFAADGSPIGDAFAVNTSIIGQQAAPHVAIDGTGRFVISFASTVPGSTPSLQVRRYSDTGVPIDRTSRAVPVSFSNHDLALAADGTATFVGIADGTAAPISTPTTVRLRRFSFDGTALGAEIVVDSVNPFFRRPAPGICTDADGRFAIAYSRAGSTGDITFKRYAANGLLLGTSAFGFRSDGNSDPVRVACLADGSHVTSYTVSDLGDFLQSDVVVNRLDSSGAVVGEFIVNDTIAIPGMGNTANSFEADLAADPAGGFAVVWSSLVITRGDDENPEAFETRIHGRRYTASGAPASAVLRIDSPQLPSRASVPVAVLSARNRVASWVEADVAPSGALQDFRVLGRQLP